MDINVICICCHSRKQLRQMVFAWEAKYFVTNLIALCILGLLMKMLFYLTVLNQKSNKPSSFCLAFFFWDTV